MWNITNYAHEFICQCMFKRKLTQTNKKNMAILFKYILRGYPNIDMLVYQLRNHKFKPRAF